MKKKSKFVADNRRIRQITKVLLKYKFEFGVTPEKVRAAIEDLGPAYIKMGQIMSMRDDIIPLEYCEELKKLRLNVTPMPFSEVRENVEKTTNKKLEEIFKSVDEKPIGSASIGQVHRATLLDGQNVVFKVMRSGIEEIVASDIRLLLIAVKSLKLLPEDFKKVDLEGVLNETWETMKKEMDFRYEVNNCKMFASLNKNFAYIGVPKIYDEYVYQNFYVMEEIQGIPISDVKKLEKEGYDTLEIAGKLVTNYIAQVVEFGFFHADPHPGNIIIRDGKIIWIDFGMVGVISQRERNLYKKAILAFISQDAYEMQNIVLSFGVIDTDKLDYAKLYGDIENMMYKYGSISMGDIDMGVLMNELFKIVKDHSITLPKGMTTLGRGIVTLEGLVAEIAPSINVLEILVDSIKTNILEPKDLMQSTYITAAKTVSAISQTAKIPSKVSTLLDLVAKGRAQANIEITNLEEVGDVFKNYSTKMAYSKIIAAMSLALSIIMAALLFFTEQNIFVVIFSIILAIAATVVIGCLLFMIVAMKISRHWKRKK